MSKRRITKSKTKSSDNEKTQKSFAWKDIKEGAGKEFNTGWLPNLAVSFIFTCVAPLIGLIMNTPKSIVIGIATGLTVLVWSIAWIVIRNIPQDFKPPEPAPLQEKVKEEPKFFSARLGGAMTITGTGQPNTVSSMLYIYQSNLGKTIAPVNYLIFVEVTNLKSITTKISKYKARALMQYEVEGKTVENWRELYSLQLLNNEVYMLLNGYWKMTRRIDFSKNSFDWIAKNTQLQSGQTVSGFMLFEVEPDLRITPFKVIKVELTIEDITGDSQVILLNPIGDKQKGSSVLLNPGELHFMEGFYDLTKEKYVLMPLMDLMESKKRKGN